MPQPAKATGQSEALLAPFIALAKDPRYISIMGWTFLQRAPDQLLLPLLLALWNLCSHVHGPTHGSDCE